MSVGIKGGSGTANVANVSTNFELQVVTPMTEADAGFAQMSAESDPGSITGSRLVRALDASEDFRLRVGMDTPAFALGFEGTVIAQAHIQQNLTTFTAAQTGGFLVLNSGNSTTVAQGANIRTYRTFSLFGTLNTYGEMWLRLVNPTATNAVTEWGFGYVSGVVATPTDGAYFRVASGGTLTAVVNFNGSETSSAAISLANIPNRDGSALPLDLTKTQHYLVSIHHDAVEFWINDVLVSRLITLAVQPLPVSATAQPLFGRTYNSGAASAARRLEIGNMVAFIGDAQSGKPWSHIMAGSGGGGYQIQPGTASGQTATYGNGAAPGAGVWTGSTAPATNTLGGLWLSPAALAVGSESDFPLFAYQNPAGTSTLPGKTLYVTGIRIGETWVTATLGTVGTILTWAVGVGSTASPTSTTDGVATVAPRRIALGAQGFAATAAVGVMAAGLPHFPFLSPLVVPPGCFFHVIVRNLLNGTAAGQLRGSVAIDAYHE